MKTNLFEFATCALAALMFGPNVVAADQPRAVTPTKTATPDITNGKLVYDHWCLDCHAPMTGFGMFPPAGSYRLQQRYHDTLPATLEERPDLTPALIRLVVRQGMTMMPPTRKTEVTDAELDAVIAYLTQKALK